MGLLNRIEELEKELLELKELVKEEQEFPQSGDDYWYVDNEGDIRISEWHGNNGFDDGRLSIGNVFHTREQTEFAVEKLKVEAELRKFSTEYQPYTELHTIVFHNNSRKVITVTANQSIQDITIYFESEEIALHAIQSVGEGRIRKYIFGLES